MHLCLICAPLAMNKSWVVPRAVKVLLSFSLIKHCHLPNNLLLNWIKQCNSSMKNSWEGRAVRRRRRRGRRWRRRRNLLTKKRLLKQHYSLNIKFHTYQPCSYFYTERAKLWGDDFMDFVVCAWLWTIWLQIPFFPVFEQCDLLDP